MQQHYDPDILIDYLHGELECDLDASIHAHIAICRDCGATVEAESRLTDGLRTLAHASEREFPAGLQLSIMDAIANDRRGPWARLSGFLRPIVVLPLGAALAAALIVFVPMTQHHTTQLSSLPVSYYLEEHAAHIQENPLADRSALNSVVETSFAQPRTSAPAFVEVANAATLAGDDAR